MSNTNTTPVPQNCPACGAVPTIENTKPRRWFVACSKNSVLVGGHQVTGHVMLTKRDAIIEWNKLLIPRKTDGKALQATG